MLVQEPVALPGEEKFLQKVFSEGITPSPEGDPLWAEYAHRLLEHTLLSPPLAPCHSSNVLHFIGRGHESRVQHVAASSAVDAALLAKLQIDCLHPAPHAAESDGE